MSNVLTNIMKCKKLLTQFKKKMLYKKIELLSYGGKRSIILLIFIIFKGELLENILSYLKLPEIFLYLFVKKNNNLI